jgi:hypothetical protein
VSPDEHDDWNAEARGETPLQRADRAYGEILQEARVAQTRVQILFAFLLTLAFTSRFAAITPFQKNVYVATLMLSAAAAASLIAPAAFHRWSTGNGSSSTWCTPPADSPWPRWYCCRLPA